MPPPFAASVRSVTRPNVTQPTPCRLAETRGAAADPTLYRQNVPVLRGTLATKSRREVTAGTAPELLLLFGCEVALPTRSPSWRPRRFIRGCLSGPPHDGAGRRPLDRTPLDQTLTRQEAPTQRIVGYEHCWIATTLFRKFLRSKAVETRPAGAGRARLALQVAEAACDGDTKDFVTVLPILVAARRVYRGQPPEDPERRRIGRHRPRPAADQNRPLGPADFFVRRVACRGTPANLTQPYEI